MTVPKLGLAIVCGLVAASAGAQQAVSAAGTGTVTGHVLCGDTGRPARFAHVVMFEVPAQVTDFKKPDPAADETTELVTALSVLNTLGKTNMVQVQTAADGSYIATDVAPGDYYVFATAAGYVSPLSHIQALAQGGADLKKGLPGVPLVHVSAERASSRDVTMERGAAISGSIVWEDGSPVSGAMMRVVPAKGEEVEPPVQFRMLAMSGNLLSLVNSSDDEGHFRLSGLPPGDYLIQASIQTGQQSGLGTGMNLTKAMAAKPLIVYAPGGFHAGDGKAVTLRAGEERRGEQVTLNLGSLHSVSGRVRSLEDGHGVNSAVVMVQDASDKNFVRSATVDAAGGFTVPFVPAGAYTLKVSEAEDTEPDTSAKAQAKSNLFGPPEKTIRSYHDGKLNVTVMDHDVVDQNVDLAVDKNPKAPPDLTKILSDEGDGEPAKK